MIKLGGTNKACAACKFQRRKCSKECILSPYFPADEPEKFHNVHRLFGVRNIKSILNEVSPDQRDEAMRSIIYESDLQAKYPVEGCLGVARRYRLLVLQAKKELRLLRNLKLKYPNLKYLDHSDSVMTDQQSQFVGVPSSYDEINLPIFNQIDSLSVFGGNGDSIIDHGSSTDSECIDVKSNSVEGEISEQQNEEDGRLDVTADNNDILPDSREEQESSVKSTNMTKQLPHDEEYSSICDEVPFGKLREELESSFKSTKMTKCNERGSKKNDAILDHEQSFLRCKEEFDRFKAESPCKSSRYIQRGMLQLNYV